MQPEKGRAENLPPDSNGEATALAWEDKKYVGFFIFSKRTSENLLNSYERQNEATLNL